MADSSNQGFKTQQPPCPHFDGENYDFWCVKMKTHLISNDVWEYVEDGYDDLGNVDDLRDEQKQQLKEHKRKDARALSMIQQGISDKIFSKIINETNAKGAWDILQNEYRRNFTYSPTTMDPSQHSDNPMHPNLYNAVKDGRVEDLDQYVDLFDTQLTPNHNTILHVATHFGKLECVAKILEMKPSLLRRVNANCENPLHIAVRERHHSIVQALIEFASELDHLDPESASGTRLEILRAINVEGDTALHLAVRGGDAKIVILLAAEDPDFQHPPNKAEETPLYLAVERYGGESMVECILACSKSPAYTGPGGRTALHAAIIFKFPVIIKKLLDRYEELIDKADAEGWTPLHYAADLFNDEAVIELVKRKKSVGYKRTSEKHYKSTALHLAVARNRTQAIKGILTYCPDSWEMVNSQGRNILHIAVDAWASRSVEYIIEMEGLESLRNQKDFEGNTPLHLLASSEMRFALTRTLKERIIRHPRANLYAFNNENKLPTDVAWTGWSMDDPNTDIALWNRVGNGRREKDYKSKLVFMDTIKRDEENKERDKAERASVLKKTSQSLTLVATLIATITFTAAFAIPGGYDGNQGPKQGMAALVRQAGFKVFAIANTIAVMCSTSSVVYYVFAAFHYFDEEKQRRKFQKGFYLVLIAIAAMTVGFISGTYAMLVRSLGLAIATTVIAGITFLIYFFELRGLFIVWYCKAFPWQKSLIPRERSWPVKMLASILRI